MSDLTYPLSEEDKKKINEIFANGTIKKIINSLSEKFDKEKDD